MHYSVIPTQNCPFCYKVLYCLKKIVNFSVDFQFLSHPEATFPQGSNCMLYSTIVRARVPSFPHRHDINPRQFLWKSSYKGMSWFCNLKQEHSMSLVLQNKFGNAAHKIKHCSRMTNQKFSKANNVKVNWPLRGEDIIKEKTGIF